MSRSPEFLKMYHETVANLARNPESLITIQPGVYSYESAREVIQQVDLLAKLFDKPVLINIPKPNSNYTIYFFSPDFVYHGYRDMLIIGEQLKLMPYAQGVRLAIESDTIAASANVANGKLESELRLGFNGTVQEIENLVKENVKDPSRWQLNFIYNRFKNKPLIKKT